MKTIHQRSMNEIVAMMRMLVKNDDYEYNDFTHICLNICKYYRIGYTLSKKQEYTLKEHIYKNRDKVPGLRYPKR